MHEIPSEPTLKSTFISTGNVRLSLKLTLFFIRYSIKLLENISPSIAERITLRLFLSPPRNHMPEWQKPFIASSEQSTLHVANKKIKMYEILEDSLASKEQAEFHKNNANHERYFYKFLPKKVTLSATDILIYDAKVAIINVRDLITGVVLQNKDYYNSSRELFNLLWNILPDVK